MKKKMKRIICLVLSVCMMMTSLMISDTKAVAATVDSSEVYIGVKDVISKSNIIGINLREGEYKIVNLKSSNKNLYVRIEYIDSSDDEDGVAVIGMCAKKKGTYTVTFDVIDHVGRITTSHSVKVHAADPIEKATFNGKSFFKGKNFHQIEQDSAVQGFFAELFSSKSKGRFKVTMGKGYKLESITMTTYIKKKGRGWCVSKKIKNGQKVTLSQYRVYYWSGDYERVWSLKRPETYVWSSGVFGATSFHVKYRDANTNQSYVKTFVVNCRAKN